MADTPATIYLRAQKVAFTRHAYEYVEHGGTEVSAKSLGVAEHAVVKTLVMQDEDAKPLIVLMHGDRKVSTKNLARQAGRKRMPIYMERSIIELPKIYINGGRRGFLVGIAPGEIVRTLAPQLVSVALDE